MQPFFTVFGFNQTVSVVIVAADLANPVNETSKNFSFTIASGNGVRGDINGNGQVDGIDLILLGASFGSTYGDSSYNRRADYDQDYVVDGIDLAVLAYYYSL